MQHGQVLMSFCHSAHTTHVYIGCDGVNVPLSATLTESLSSAQENLEQAKVYRDIEEAVADKGYHANKTLADCRDWGCFGLRTYIPEPDSPTNAAGPTSRRSSRKPCTPIGDESGERGAKGCKETE